MLHEPAPASQQRDGAVDAKARIGLRLFVFYSLVYVGFVAINLIRPQWMKAPVLLGLNLAVVYGFGLILLAIVLGLVYSRWCGIMEEKMRHTGSEQDTAAKQGGSK